MNENIYSNYDILTKKQQLLITQWRLQKIQITLIILKVIQYESWKKSNNWEPLNVEGYCYINKDELDVMNKTGGGKKLRRRG